MKFKKTFVFVAAAVVATIAYAMPPYSYNITYYTDASLTTVAGTGYRTCQNQTVLWSGTKTAYSTMEEDQSCF